MNEPHTYAIEISNNASKEGAAGSGTHMFGCVEMDHRKRKEGRARGCGGWDTLMCASFKDGVGRLGRGSEYSRVFL